MLVGTADGRVVLFDASRPPAPDGDDVVPSAATATERPLRRVAVWEPHAGGRTRAVALAHGFAVTGGR